jgi:hypothetical protein
VLPSYKLTEALASGPDSNSEMPLISRYFSGESCADKKTKDEDIMDKKKTTFLSMSLISVPVFTQF